MLLVPLQVLMLLLFMKRALCLRLNVLAMLLLLLLVPRPLLCL